MPVAGLPLRRCRPARGRGRRAGRLPARGHAPARTAQARAAPLAARGHLPRGRRGALALAYEGVAAGEADPRLGRLGERGRAQAPPGGRRGPLGLRGLAGVPIAGRDRARAAHARDHDADHRDGGAAQPRHTGTDTEPEAPVERVAADPPPAAETTDLDIPDVRAARAADTAGDPESPAPVVAVVPEGGLRDSDGRGRAARRGWGRDLLL